MSQAFIEGMRIPITYIKAGPCVVTQVKREEKDGYWAVQLGFGERKIKNTSKPLQGHLRGAIKEDKAPRFLREVALDKEPEFRPGDIVSVSDIFKVGDRLQITGTSKGKGFAGVVKRWGFAGGPKTHGQSDRLRAPGSIGQGTTPGRVHKGKKMAGRMGADRVTVKNLVVVSFGPGKDDIVVSGPVPGSPGGLLILRKIGSGKLHELVEETAQPQVHEGEGESSEIETEKGEEQTQKESAPPVS